MVLCEYDGIEKNIRNCTKMFPITQWYFKLLFSVREPTMRTTSTHTYASILFLENLRLMPYIGAVVDNLCSLYSLFGKWVRGGSIPTILRKHLLHVLQQSSYAWSQFTRYSLRLLASQQLFSPSVLLFTIHMFGWVRRELSVWPCAFAIGKGVATLCAACGNTLEKLNISNCEKVSSDVLGEEANPMSAVVELCKVLLWGCDPLIL